MLQALKLLVNITVFDMEYLKGFQQGGQILPDIRDLSREICCVNLRDAADMICAV